MENGIWSSNDNRSRLNVLSPEVSTLSIIFPFRFCRYPWSHVGARCRKSRAAFRDNFMSLPNIRSHNSLCTSGHCICRMDCARTSTSCLLMRRINSRRIKDVSILSVMFFERKSLLFGKFRQRRGALLPTLPSVLRYCCPDRPAHVYPARFAWSCSKKSDIRDEARRHSNKAVQTKRCLHSLIIHNFGTSSHLTACYRLQCRAIRS